MTPIHSPPEPNPISARPANTPGNPGSAASVNVPNPDTASATSKVERMRPARTRGAAAAKPTIIANGKAAATAPITATPA